MNATVGIIANPRSGKDIRRLVAHAPAPSDTSRVADIRRLIVGADEGGADRVLVSVDAHGLAARAVQGLEIDVELVDIDPQGTGEDSAQAAAAMRDLGAGVLVAYGGDGTQRQICRGWRDAPLVAVSGGTNNAFPQMIEPTVAGAAAGFAVGGGVPLEDLIAYQALVIDVDIEGIPEDLALVDVAVIRGTTGGGPSVWSVDGIDQILASFAEPWSVGLSALAGAIAPTSRTDDRGVLLDLDPTAPKRVRAPIAPGRYVEAGLASVSVVECEQPVAVRGPATFAFDGERGSLLGAEEWGSMTLRRNGPRVLDIKRAFSMAVREGHFYSEQAQEE